ncbi:glycosyltransferase [Aerosakkonema funiforme]|uniref:glycosyltransferase n=1 Tax=Aerosakkonema funiforme TaxID=1246630 RepID=UPI0035B6F7A1
MTSNNNSVSLFLPSLTGGGAERVMLHLAQGLAARGLHIDLVLQNAEGPYLKQVPIEVRVIDLKSPDILSKTLALRRYLQQERPQVLLSALDNVNAGKWAQRLAGVSTRVVLSVHNHLSHYLQGDTGIAGKIRPHLLRYFYRSADGIVAVSQGVAEDLADMTGLPLEKIQVIYNPVIMPEVFEKAKAPINHPWFAPGEPPVLLGVGRLVNQKDFPTLIRAFAQVRQERAVRLMILGEGEKRSQLESLVRELRLENDVALPGFVENPYAYMAKSAGFVLSSEAEGLPTVMIEAMATGTPVVSTDCPSGPAEILENGKYGYLVPVGDAEALAHAILATLNEPIDSKILQQRARDFSVDKAVDRYLEVLQSVGNRD